MIKPAYREMERRGSIRLERALPVRFDFPDIFKQTRTFEVLSRNISEGGIFIETDIVQSKNFALAKDTILKLEIEFLGQGQKIKPKGRIVWISRKSRIPQRKRSGFGVKFIRIDAKEKQAISLFISQETLAQSELREKEISLISKEQKLTDRQRRNLEIINAIRKKRLISRSGISKVTNINVVTISNYIDAYLKKGLAFERGLDISSGGRRPELVGINPHYGYVIGVDLGFLNVGSATMQVVAVDFTTQVKAKALEKRQSDNPKDSLDVLKELIEKVCASNQVKREKVKGIGIGISGIMDKFAGTVRNPLTGNICANYITIKKELEGEFNLPVFIENSASCALFAERWIGLSLEVKTSDNIIYVFSDNQCAKMLKGELYTGSSKSAGQLNFVFSPDRSTADYCWAQPSNDCIFRPINKILELITQEEILALGTRLGVKIAHLINLFNPQLVIIGRYFSQLGDVFLDSIRSTVDNWVLKESSQQVRIIPATLGEDTVAVGAASLVIESVFANI